MKRFLLFTGILCIGLAVAAPSGAGDKKKKDAGPPKVKRGPEHKVLQSLVGAFDAKVKMFLDPSKATESKGLMTRKMILGGNFLQETFKGEFFGAPFNGMGVIGYDPNKKKYVNTWFDSMSLSTTIMDGTYDADKKTFTMVGEDFDPNTKKPMKARDVLKIVSAEKQTFEMYRQPEGAPAEIKVMEITYTRKAPAKKKKDKA